MGRLGGVGGAVEAELEELVDREERLIKVLNPGSRQALDRPWRYAN